MRAETAVAQAELALVEAQNAADLAEVQMKVALHLPAGAEHVVPGEGLDTVPPPFQGNLHALLEEGLANRYEVKSVLANAAAARQTAAANKAARYPVVSAFGDGVEGTRTRATSRRTRRSTAHGTSASRPPGHRTTSSPPTAAATTTRRAPMPLKRRLR